MKSANLLSRLSVPCLFASLLLSALIAGFFYAYSVDVMRGLDRMEPAEAIRAMQQINIAVRNPVFFTTFFVTPAAAAATALLLYLSGSKSAALAMVGAAAIYMVAAFLPTASINVPMNEALALQETGVADGRLADIWQAYSTRWTFWNTFRTVASSIAVLLTGLAIALHFRKSW